MYASAYLFFHTVTDYNDHVITKTINLANEKSTIRGQIIFLISFLMFSSKLVCCHALFVQ